MSLQNVDCLIKSCTGARSRSNVIEELMRRELDEEYLNKGIVNHRLTQRLNHFAYIPSIEKGTCFRFKLCTTTPGKWIKSFE